MEKVNGVLIILIYFRKIFKRYNCTIIDLHDRSVIASINVKNITSNLAIQTLKLT